MRSHPVAAFAVLVLVITWGLQLPAVLAKHGVIAGPYERFLPLLGLGAFGPTFAALVAARLERGPTPARTLLRPLARWRVAPWWYPVALLLPGALFVAAMALYTLVAGHSPGPWFYPPHQADALIAMVVFPLGEEIGWRGFAQPRLTERYGPLVASLLVGLLWGVWHLPMFDLSGVSPAILAAMLPFFVAGSVVFGWIYTRTGSSLLLVVLAHAGAHLNNSNKALPANALPVYLHTAAFVLFAAALVALDRAVFRPAKSLPRA